MKNIAQFVGFGALAFLLGYYAALPDETVVEASHIQAGGARTSERQGSRKTPGAENQIQDDLIKKLNQQLKLAKTEISDLQSKNANLAKQIGHMDLPVSPSIEYPELISKVDNLPLPLINEQLARLFDDYALKHISDPRGFAKRLIDVALTDQEEPVVQIVITFSTSPLAGARLLSERASVAGRDTVFGHISASGGLNENVIVKWRNAGTGEILSLTNQILNTNGREQYVWMRPKKGWEPGRYDVSIYSMDDHVSPLGGAAFTLVSVTGAQPGQGVDQVMQDLINSGQAMRKQTR